MPLFDPDPLDVYVPAYLETCAESDDYLHGDDWLAGVGDCCYCGLEVPCDA